MTAKNSRTGRRSITEEAPFWQRKRLGEMSHTEWESLCDGCGRCCLIKLEDAETGDIDYTDIACRLLDLESCRCGDASPSRSFMYAAAF